MGAATLHLFILKNEILTMEGIKTPKLTVPITASTDRLPFGEHVPHVQTFCPTCALLKAADIDAPQFLSKPIGATFRLTAGTLAAVEGAVNCNWDFDQEASFPNPSPMKLAQEVAIDLDVEPQLKIKSSLSSAEKKLDITLKAGEAVIVTIGSAPLEDILLVPPADHSMIDQHFGLYYELLEPGVNKTHPLPINIGGCLSQIQHRLGGANCPPSTQWP
jgi:hypothetical protein